MKFWRSHTYLSWLIALGLLFALGGWNRPTHEGCPHHQMQSMPSHKTMTSNHCSMMPMMSMHHQDAAEHHQPPSRDSEDAHTCPMNLHGSAQDCACMKWDRPLAVRTPESTGTLARPLLLTLSHEIIQPETLSPTHLTYLRNVGSDPPRIPGPRTHVWHEVFLN
jgi:hypothetical protein